MFLRYSPDTDAWQLMGYFSGLSRDDVAWAAHEDVAFIMGGAHLYPWPDPDLGIPGENYRMDLSETWSLDIRDCSGIAEGSVIPGTPCNDGNSGTYGDAYDNQCICTGASQPVQPFRPDVIDNTFSTGTGFDGEVKALALQPDGKLIATGAFSTFNGISCNGIARLNADGSLDEGFVGAIGGKALALQPDGRIVVGANGIFRLMPNGSIDPDFNAYLNNIGVQPVNALVVRPDGRIIAGGAFIISDEWGNEVPMSIMQLFQDGSLDNSFVPVSSNTMRMFKRWFCARTASCSSAWITNRPVGGGTMAPPLPPAKETGDDPSNSTAPSGSALQPGTRLGTTTERRRGGRWGVLHLQ
ncbi:MAG: hypothetical protein IPP33_08415 [Flavobacteriales bacterium]|nr:hypothetical protein [Flavobacteriales bacterium]